MNESLLLTKKIIRRDPRRLSWERMCWFWPQEDNKKNRVTEFPMESLRETMQWKFYRNKRCCGAVGTVETCRWQHHKWLQQWEVREDTIFSERGDGSLEQPVWLFILPEEEPCTSHWLEVCPGVLTGAGCPPNPGQEEHKLFSIPLTMSTSD